MATCTRWVSEHGLDRIQNLQSGDITMQQSGTALSDWTTPQSGSLSSVEDNLCASENIHIRKTESKPLSHS